MSLSIPASQALAPRYLTPDHSSSTARSTVIAFGAAAGSPLVSIPAPFLGGDGSLEVWPSRDDVMFGAIAVKEEGALEEVSRAAYARLLSEIRDHGHPHLLRVWNHVGAINRIDDGRERYQRFCEGRHNAFADAGWRIGNDLPSASAVGIAEGLIIYYLASRRPGMHIENPRQVAAYRYPPRYGRRSPSFSRATIFDDAVFVSGTASIVGHASAHVGDVSAQLDETLRNLEAVLRRAGCALRDLVSVKTYIRDARHYDEIARRLRAALPPGCSQLYLQADICRSELLLEIEGVAAR